MGMKRTLCFLLLAALFLSVLPCVAEEDDPYALPLDISVGGYPPDPAGVRPDGYEDESLSIRKEMIRYNDVNFHVVWVKVKSPTQLRTATSGKPNQKLTALPSKMGKKLNAVFVCNGEYYIQRTRDIFIYRQGIMYRNEPDPIKDVLIIDDKGDFHIFNTENKKDEIAAFQEAGGVIVNAFSFGPTLVLNGEVQDVHDYHLFDGFKQTQRTAIGQVGPLSYVFVRCEGKKTNSRGCNHQQMADFCGTLGLQCAYNLDGGQSSVILLNGKYADDSNRNSERAQSDIIYVVSAVDPKAKGK